MKVKFTVPGPPQGKGRPRFLKTGQPYTPEKTKQYEKKIAACYKQQCGRAFFDRGIPIDLRITAYFPIAKSDSKKTDSKKTDSKTDSKKTESKTESKKADTPADPSINVENQAFWRESLQKYRHDDKVHQIMLVRCTEGCKATVQYYEKLTDENDVWSLTFETEAIIGKNGPEKTGEGDAKTPYGDFGVRGAFGIRSNPGTDLPYTEIKETTFACDEEGEYYNQIIDTKETGHECKGEEMYELSPEYNYGIETDFNSKNEWPKGSAIFIHCKGTKKFTGGCVALDEELMKKVLETADSGMRIIIHGD